MRECEHCPKIGIEVGGQVRCREHMPLTPDEQVELAMLENAMHDSGCPERGMRDALLPFLGEPDTKMEADFTSVRAEFSTGAYR